MYELLKKYLEARKKRLHHDRINKTRLVKGDAKKNLKDKYESKIHELEYIMSILENDLYESIMYEKKKTEPIQSLKKSLKK